MVEVVRMLKNSEGPASRICWWSQCRSYENSITHFGWHPTEISFTLTYITLQIQGLLPTPLCHTSGISLQG